MKKKKERVAFFTFVSDNYYYGVGTHLMANSFKKFHPDIDLVVFRQDVVDRVLKSNNVNFFNAKPTFAKLLTPYYDLIVNIDADTIILDRLDHVLKDDYEVGGAWNFNSYENATFENITPEMYVQAGLIGSRNPKFWDIWERENTTAYKYVRAENDVLNLVWYNDPEVSKMKRVIYDKDIPDYYGCKSLGKEGSFIVINGDVRCEGGKVFAYHHAKGGGAMPKLQFEKMGFRDDVAAYMKFCGYYGTTQHYSNI